MALKGKFPTEYRYRKDKPRSVQATGEFRAPRKGEFFLSGAIVEAYEARQDMNTKYWIAKEED
jgi:hypothetical protein